MFGVVAVLQVCKGHGVPMAWVCVGPLSRVDIPSVRPVQWNFTSLSDAVCVVHLYACFLCLSSHATIADNEMAGGKGTKLVKCHILTVEIVKLLILS